MSFDRTTPEGLLASTIEDLREEAAQKRRDADSLEANAADFGARAERLRAEAAAADHLVLTMKIGQVEA